MSEQNELLIQQFLSLVLKPEFVATNNKEAVFSALSQEVICWGFPEKNPENALELIQFINGIHDAFFQLQYNSHILISDDIYVFVRLQIQGQHRKTFMGFPASDGGIMLEQVALFKLQNALISEINLYNKKLSITTPNGNVFELKGKS